MQAINTDVVLSAVITTILMVFILLVVQRKLRLSGKIFFLTLVAALPLSYIINQIKIPILNNLFTSKVTSNSLTLVDGLLWVFIVGFTEELIKFILFILIIQTLNHYSLKNYKNTVVVAYCTGIGFGIGEIWYLVSLLLYYSVPDANLIAWLGGFGFERFFVTFGHAAMFMVIIYGYRKNDVWTGIYLLAAMIIHALYDLPIILASIKIISSLELALIIFIEIIASFIISFILLYLLIEYSENDSRKGQKEALLQRARKSFE